ncbi:MAG: YbaK/EbsC family protein [Acidobacteriota bacterium]|nr:YbaK/EbsC family protein [Acidobacteriota bacterium]
MSILQRCFNYLEKHGVRYSHSIHSPARTALETADAERMPAHELAKTVVYHCDNGFGMAVVPADHFLDFGELRRALGLSGVRLAYEAELEELFPGCELGAMPPFGPLFDLPVIVDEYIAAQEFTAFNAGTHRDVIRMSFEDYRRLVKPLIGFVSLTKEVFA